MERRDDGDKTTNPGQAAFLECGYFKSAPVLVVLA